MLLKHRRARAIQNMEQQFVSLLYAATLYKENLSDWDRKLKGQELATQARRYARSVDRVRRT